MEKATIAKEPLQVGYVFSQDLLCLANRLPQVECRVSFDCNFPNNVNNRFNFSQAFFVHQLIAAYGLLQKCAKIEMIPATDYELRKFHRFGWGSNFRENILLYVIQYI